MTNTPEQNWRKGFNDFLEDQNNSLVHLDGKDILYKDLTSEKKAEYQEKKRQDDNVKKAVELRGIEVDEIIR